MGSGYGNKESGQGSLRKRRPKAAWCSRFGLTLGVDGVGPGHQEFLIGEGKEKEPVSFLFPITEFKLTMKLIDSIMIPK